MWKAAKVRKIPLRQFKIMAALYHGTDNLGDSFNLIKVFPNFRICFPYMVFIVSPGCHAVSSLSCNPIVAFSLGLLNFAAWSFLCLLTKLMKKHISIIFVEEV